MMNKPFYKSMTFYGALGMGAEAALLSYIVKPSIISAIVAGLSIFLTAFGLRRALP